MDEINLDKKADAHGSSDSSREQGMNIMCIQNFVIADSELRTPDLGKHTAKSQDVAQKIPDSGFCSAQRSVLERRSSVSSSLGSSPEHHQERFTASRRITLANCNFSPVTRESFSVIRSRKLSFNMSDPLPQSFQMDHEGAVLNFKSSVQREENNGGGEVKCNLTESQDSSLSVSPLAPGLFSYDPDTLAQRLARLSPENELETSLQNMSLEESSSMSSSSSHSRSNSVSTSPDIVSELPDFSNGNPQSKDIFMSAIQLTNTGSTSAIHSPPPSVVQNVISTSTSSACDTDIQNPPMYPTLSCEDAESIGQGCQALSPGRTFFMKSPCKRIGSVETDVCNLLSPTKCRKTYKSTKTSPGKVSRNILSAGGYPEFQKNFEECNITSPMSISQNSPEASGLCVSGSVGDSMLSPCISNPGSLPSGFYSLIKKMSPPNPSKLIGRNIGILKLDIIGCLHPHFGGCVGKILGSLEANDLINVYMVSQVWRQALKNDSASYLRYKHHVRDMNHKKRLLISVEKENDVGKADSDRASTPMTVSNGYLTSLQIQAPPKQLKSPSEEIQTPTSGCTGLQCGDLLRSCPRCQQPALLKPHQNRASCRDQTCGYDFCIQCFAAFHHPRPCKPLNRTISKNDVAGSVKSKRNLKRL